MTAAGLTRAVRRVARDEWALPAIGVIGSTLIVLGPALRPGYTLAYDMVFAPRMPVDADSVGLGSGLPRAVPSDLVVSLLTHVLPGDLVQKLVLALLLALAGFGAARLTEPIPTARLAAALAYLWTPYVAERLLIGQWAVLVGYSALPWVLSAARGVRAGTGRPSAAWVRLVLVLGLASLGGGPAWLLALLVAPVTAAWGVPARRAARNVLGSCAALVVFALPWALPAVLRPGGTSADPAGAVVFAPRADSPLGRVGSLVTGGGIWADTVPPGRETVLGAACAVVVLLLGVAGLRLARMRDPLPPLMAASLVGTGFAVVAAWPAGARAIARLPGAALIRDTQRLVAPLILLIALGVGATAAYCVQRLRADGRAFAVLVAMVPLAALPGLGWGVAGRLHAVTYPADFGHVRRLLHSDRRPGAVLVLPFEAYRRYPWNGGRTSLDVLARWLSRPVVLSDDLPVQVGERTVVIRGEDRLAARVAAVLARPEADVPDALGRLGVRWVVTDAAVAPSQVSGLRPRWIGRQVNVYDVPAPRTDAARDPLRDYRAPTAAVITGDALAGLLVLVAAAGAAAQRTFGP